MFLAEKQLTHAKVHDMSDHLTFADCKKTRQISFKDINPNAYATLREKHSHLHTCYKLFLQIYTIYTVHSIQYIIPQSNSFIFTKV